MRAILLCLAGCAVAEPEPPLERTLQISPRAPGTEDTLTASAPDAPAGATLHWVLAGESLVTGPTVGAELTEKGQRWRVELRQGDEVLVWASVLVRNTPPTVQAQLPAYAQEGHDLTVQVTTFDADGDEVILSPLWTRSTGAPPLLTATVEHNHLYAGDAWSVEVHAFDGEDSVVATAGPVPVVGVAQEIFAGTTPSMFAIELTEEAVEALDDEPTDWVPADLTWNGVLYPDVGVRLKGKGSFAPIGKRSAFRVEMNRYVAGQSLDGLVEFALNNMASDPTLVHERLAYALMREVGVPAPRARHIGLTVNAEFMGPYTLVEHPDTTFLRSTFGDGRGPLYEMEDTELLPGSLDTLDHDGGPDNLERIVLLANLLADPVASLSGQGAELLDVDAWADYLAAAGVVGHFDGYPYKAPSDDLYLYVDPTDGRIRFVVHGADEAFLEGERPFSLVEGQLGLRCLRETLCRERVVSSAWGFQDAAERMDLAGLADQAIAEAELLTEASYPLQFSLEERAAAQAELAAFLRDRRTNMEAMILLQTP